MALPPSSFSAAFEASTFDDSDTAFEAVREYAKAHMFAIFVRSSKPGRCVWACSKAGRLCDALITVLITVGVDA
jgi:hypothetical protein